MEFDKQFHDALAAMKCHTHILTALKQGHPEADSRSKADYMVEIDTFLNRKFKE